MSKILVIDDDNMARRAISENLKASGFITVEASNGREAINVLQKEKPDSVLLDLQMPDMDGIETMQKIKEIDANVPVIIVTGHGNIPTAVESIKLGAYDFLVKPPDFDKLILTLKRAVEKNELDKKLTRLKNEVETSLEFMLGKSTAMKKVIQQIHQISQSDFSLILQGDTGTGKSFIARTVHNLSNRAKGPFVTVDICAIPETLVESELFGYEKGAFTGAEKRKKGFFEIANDGTLLIDELQNLSPYVQSKLLAAVEEKSIVPLGSSQPVKTDIRIIGATNKDILNAVKEEKTFREDLFYRLSEFMITLPPLKDRTDDIAFLAEKFCMEASEDLNKHIYAISSDAMIILKNYQWPGNIRELKNVIRRAVLLSEQETVGPEHIEFLINDSAPKSSSGSVLDEISGLSLAEIEKSAILKVIDITNGNKSKAASLLKIDYTTLLRKLKQYGI